MLQHRPAGDVQALKDGYWYLFNMLSYIIYVSMEGLCRWLSSRMLQHRPSGDVQALEDGYLYLFNLSSYIIYVLWGDCADGCRPECYSIALQEMFRP